jgi:hypothetical protein
MAEVTKVGTAADMTSAVMALMGSNPPCGQCLMRCATATDSTSCAMACGQSPEVLAAPPAIEPQDASSDPPDNRPCSVIELTDVLGAAERATAVMGMMVTNAACALCLIPCGAATDAVACAQSCTRPMEAACSAADLRVIELMGLPSGLGDRGQVVAMLGATSAPCAFCVAETIHSVCGKNCCKERLHIGLYDLQIGARCRA